LDNLYTFKKEREYSSPTEEIEIAKIKTVKSDENTSTNIFVKIQIIQNFRKLNYQAHNFVSKPKVWKRKKLGLEL